MKIVLWALVWTVTVPHDPVLPNLAAVVFFDFDHPQGAPVPEKNLPAWDGFHCRVGDRVEAIAAVAEAPEGATVRQVEWQLRYDARLLAFAGFGKDPECEGAVTVRDVAVTSPTDRRVSVKWVPPAPVAKAAIVGAFRFDAKAAGETRPAMNAVAIVLGDGTRAQAKGVVPGPVKIEEARPGE